MARESTITQEQVNAAADGLRAADIRPTVRAVREKLGNTGSNATVMRLLAVWQSGQVRPAETPITLPAGLQRALVDFVAQAVAAGKAELAAELAELQQVNADLAGESERLAGTLAALDDELEAARRDRDAQAGRARQLEADLGLVRGEAETERVAAELARTELAKAQLRLEAMPALEARLRATETVLEQAREGKAAAEQAAAVAAARLEAAQAAGAHLAGELEAARAREAERVDEFAAERLAHAKTQRALTETTAQLGAWVRPGTANARRAFAPGGKVTPAAKPDGGKQG